MREVWKDVKGFEDIYQISNKGRLKSFKRMKDGYILSTKNSKGDYLSVVLEYKDLKRYVRIHTLVAEAFIPNPYNKPQVNHKDGDKQNNCVENLEWVTEKENIRHAIKQNPKMLKGMIRYNRIIRPRTIQQLSMGGKLLAEYSNAVEASKATGVCHRNILQVASKDEYKPGKVRKQAGGFRWRYKNDTKKSGDVIGY